MPTRRMPGSLASSTSSGCSCRHGPHQDAHTFTTVTRPLKILAGEAGDRLAVRGRPSSGGKAKAGAGRPIRAEGTFDGIAGPRGARNNSARPVKTSTGSREQAQALRGRGGSATAGSPRRPRRPELGEGARCDR